MTCRHLLVWSAAFVLVMAAGVAHVGAEPVAARSVSLPSSGVIDLAFSDDGRHLILREDGRVRVVSMEDGNEVGAVELSTDEVPVHVLGSHAGATRVLVAGDRLTVHALPDDARLAIALDEPRPEAIAVSHDGTRLAALVIVTRDDVTEKRLRLYDLERGGLTLDVVAAPDGDMDWYVDHVSLAWSPDDAHILVALGESWSAGCGGGDERTRVGVFRAADGERLAFDEGGAAPPWLWYDALTPDGRWLTSCDSDGGCVIWDLTEASAQPAMIVDAPGARSLVGVVPAVEAERPPMLAFRDRLVDPSKPEGEREQPLPQGFVVDEAAGTADGRFVVMRGQGVGGGPVIALWSIERAGLLTCLQSSGGTAVRAVPSPTDATRVALLTDGGAVGLQRVGRPQAEPLACAGLIP